METITEIGLKFFSCPMNSKIFELRHQALKPNDFKSSVILEKDFLKTTMHFVACTPESLKKPVCCVSYFLNTFQDAPAYQLRGMATAKEFQEMGIGERLIAFAESIISKEKGITAFWCDVPVELVSFFEKQGWTCSGEAFVLPNLGLRKKMSKGIAPF